MHDIDKCGIPFVGNCEIKKLVQFIQGGECKADLTTLELPVQAEPFKLGLCAYVCLPFPNVNGK